MSKELPINTIICGDCMEVMRKMPSNSIDTILTDPPYGLGFMGKEWDTFKEGSKAEYYKSHKPNKQLYEIGVGIRKVNQPIASAAALAGSYDHSRNTEFQQWFTVWAKEVLRIAKPGAMMLCFGGTRTSHRLICAIEDAGWLIRDKIFWMFGSGFPKSHDISKAIDKAGGKDCSWFIDYAIEIVEKRDIPKKELTNLFLSKTGKPTGWLYNKSSHSQALTVEQFNKIKDFLNLPFRNMQEAKREIIGKKTTNKTIYQAIGSKGESGEIDLTIPATDLAKLWDGYGTALKPAYEIIVVAMKPLDGTFAQNAEKWGVAGLNIDKGRIGTERPPTNPDPNKFTKFKEQDGYRRQPSNNPDIDINKGRWPANVILDEEAGRLLDLQSGKLKSGDNCRRTKEGYFGEHGGLGKAGDLQTTYGDSGGASRFFYCAKSSRAERNMGGCVNAHPT